MTLSRDLNLKDIPKLLEGVEFEGDFLKADKIIPAPDEKEGNKRRLEVHLCHGKKEKFEDYSKHTAIL